MVPFTFVSFLIMLSRSQKVFFTNLLQKLRIDTLTKELTTVRSAIFLKPKTNFLPLWGPVLVTLNGTIEEKAFENFNNSCSV